MAEAEDVIADAAHHATQYAQSLWQRRRKGGPSAGRVGLADVAARLDLLIVAAFGTAFPIRVAQPPAPPTVLRRLFQPGAGHLRTTTALPAIDEVAIYLPAGLDLSGDAAIARYRTMALQQAMRRSRRAACHYPFDGCDMERDLYLLIEAACADRELAQALPGLAEPLRMARRQAAAARPSPAVLTPAEQRMEVLYRSLLCAHPLHPPAELADCGMPVRAIERARVLAIEVAGAGGAYHGLRKDWLLGEILPTRRDAVRIAPHRDEEAEHEARRVPSARMRRCPKVRKPQPDEDDARPGTWMVQTAQPHEHVEDPMGMQRPTDRDEHKAADDFADSLAELDEARLVSTPGTPGEFLLGDDTLERQAPPASAPGTPAEGAIRYPEWDCFAEAYRLPGAKVHVRPPAEGAPGWADGVLAKRKGMLGEIRRQFELLKARRALRRRQPEGDEIDLAAYLDAYSDFRAGLPLGQNLYQRSRPARRSMAIGLLIDISGSTDSWVSAHRRVIDVEKEALLLVCLALESLAEPYTVQAFSGESMAGVSVRPVKGFEEAYGERTARRIAALEPERYTRAGAAIRHATALLMAHAAERRLLLLLSDGKPNDMDHYEGRYGIEDMRQSIAEAKLQGVSAFCLTVDRHAANYLPHVFGPRQYGLLPRPELLPLLLLDWLKRLIRPIA